MCCRCWKHPPGDWLQSRFSCVVASAWRFVLEPYLNLSFARYMIMHYLCMFQTLNATVLLKFLQCAAGAGLVCLVRGLAANTIWRGYKLRVRQKDFNAALCPDRCARTCTISSPYMYTSFAAYTSDATLEIKPLQIDCLPEVIYGMALAAANCRCQESPRLRVCSG